MYKIVNIFQGFIKYKFYQLDCVIIFVGLYNQLVIFVFNVVYFDGLVVSKFKMYCFFLLILWNVFVVFLKEELMEFLIIFFGFVVYSYFVVGRYCYERGLVEMEKVDCLVCYL